MIFFFVFCGHSIMNKAKLCSWWVYIIKEQIKHTPHHPVLLIYQENLCSQLREL